MFIAWRCHWCGQVQSFLPQDEDSLFMCFVTASPKEWKHRRWCSGQILFILTPPVDLESMDVSFNTTLVPSQKPRNSPGSSFGDVIHSTQKHREIASTMDRLLSIIESGRAGNNSKFSGALINCCFVLPRVTAPEIRWKCRTPRILLRGIQNIKHRAVIHQLTHLRLK